MVLHTEITELVIEIPAPIAVNETSGPPWIVGKDAGDLIPVPAELAGVLAPARWCVFEWTTYTASSPSADPSRAVNLRR